MTVKEYRSEVKAILQNGKYSYDNGFSVIEKDVIKNNNLQLHGLIIRNKNYDVAPNIYVDEYYERRLSPEEASENIDRIYNNPDKEMEQFLRDKTESFMDFENAKSDICYKVINSKKNKDMLSNIPNVQLADDLCAVFYLNVNNEMSCLINKQIVDKWKLDRKEATRILFDNAAKNTRRINPPYLRSLFQLIEDMSGIEMDDEMKSELVDGSAPFYVLTNRDKMYGASTILYGDGTVLKECENKIKEATGLDFQGMYILPSSIHEVLLVPALDDFKKEELQKMVMEVNRTELSKEEFLSDNIFYYSEDKGFRQITHSEKSIEIAR